MAIMPVGSASSANIMYSSQVNTAVKNNVPFTGKQDFTTENKKSHRSLIIAGGLIGAAILGFVFRRPLTKLFRGEEIQQELKPIEKRITSFYDDLVTLSGLKRKPKLEFVKKIDIRNTNGVIGTPTGFYNHASHTIQINTDMVDDLHQVFFINKKTGKKGFPMDSFRQTRYITSEDISKIKAKPDLAVDFMKRYKVNPKEYDFSYKKLEGNELEAYLAKTLIHELRHAYQKEIMHRTFGLETILEIQKESMRKTVGTTLTANESEKIITEELKKGYKVWENCPVDIAKNSEEGKLAQKFLEHFKTESQGKSNYSTDPFEKDAYAYQYSDKIADYIASKFGVSKQFAQRI